MSYMLEAEKSFNRDYSSRHWYWRYAQVSLALLYRRTRLGWSI